MTFVEKPVAFGREDHLVGIVCRPREEPSEPRPVLVFLNAGVVHRIGPHRLYVRLARALAADGVQSLRFDLSGIGDTLVPRGEAVAPIESVHRDIQDALDYAENRLQADRVIVLGLCSGADHAFHAAVVDARVSGAVLVDPNLHRPRAHTLHHYKNRVLDPLTWKLLLRGRHPRARAIMNTVLGRNGAEEPEQRPAGLAASSLPSHQVRQGELRAVLDRGVELQYIFSGGLERFNHRKQLYRAYPGLDLQRRVRFEYFRRSDHTFSDRRQQDQLIAAVRDWVRSAKFPQRTQAYAGSR